MTHLPNMAWLLKIGMASHHLAGLVRMTKMKMIGNFRLRQVMEEGAAAVAVLVRMTVMKVTGVFGGHLRLRAAAAPPGGARAVALAVPAVLVAGVGAQVCLNLSLRLTFLTCFYYPLSVFTRLVQLVF